MVLATPSRPQRRPQHYEKVRLNDLSTDPNDGRISAALSTLNGSQPTPRTKDRFKTVGCRVRGAVGKEKGV